jgi:hypothetical protein
MNLGNDKALWLLFLVPAVLVPVYAWCFWRKARALRALASCEMLAKINNSVSLGRQVFKALLLVLAFVLIVLALTEPKWNPQPQQIRRQGRGRRDPARHSRPCSRKTSSPIAWSDPRSPSPTCWKCFRATASRS